MSQKMKDILLAGNKAIAEGNHEEFLEFCTDDTEWNFIGDQVLRGKEAVRKYMKATYLQPPEVTVDKLVAEGEFLIAIGKISMNGEDPQEYCDVWQFRGDKLARLKAFVV